jgi:hypothetical protein
LHGVPTKVKSAVKLLSERCTLLALYPEQLSAVLSVTPSPFESPLKEEADVEEWYGCGYGVNKEQRAIVARVK